MIGSICSPCRFAPRESYTWDERRAVAFLTFGFYCEYCRIFSIIAGDILSASLMIGCLRNDASSLVFASIYVCRNIYLSRAIFCNGVYGRAGVYFSYWYYFCLASRLDILSRVDSSIIHFSICNVPPKYHYSIGGSADGVQAYAFKYHFSRYFVCYIQYWKYRILSKKVRFSL